MLWSPSGPTVPATISPAQAARFVPIASLNLGGVARVWSETAGTFTLGGTAVTNTYVIPIGIGQEVYVAYGPDVTHISASAVTIFVTPGIARP